MGISIHAPRVGSDRQLWRRDVPYARFQSTLPVWGATYLICSVSHDESFQSTLPVWGATSKDEEQVESLAISIHAPRVGSDSTQPVISTQS